jgi:hypothetical protein
MLLDDVDFGNRLRCALIVRVEERKLLEVRPTASVVTAFLG